MPMQPDDPRPATARKTRILVVDDHAIVRRGLASLINVEPDLVICGEADSVETAITQIKKTHPDLVIVDMSLREGDGLEVLRLMQEDYPHVLALVLSMYDETVYAERVLRLGAKGYVRKVDVSETIITAIRQVLAGKVYASPAVAAAVLQQLSGTKRAEPGSAAQLTNRELQVLRAIGRGLNNLRISEELFISVKTVEAHRENIKQKLGLPTSSDLLQYAIEFCRH